MPRDIFERLLLLDLGKSPGLTGGELILAASGAANGSTIVLPPSEIVIKTVWKVQRSVCL